MHPFNKMPPLGRSLLTVLQDGEIVQFREVQAYFISGHLVHSDDQTKLYTSPSAFANDVSGGSINGWLQCKVMRDGVWKRLSELPIIAWTLTADSKLLPPDPLKSNSNKSVEMVTKIRRVKPAPPTQSLTVSAIEMAEPALPVRSVIRISVRNCEVGSKSYWLHTAKEKLFQKHANCGVGAYVGRLAGECIDTSIPDSDGECA